LDRLAIDALPNPQRRVLAVLALAAGALLPPDLVSAMASVADIREAISDLNAHGLAERHEDRFGLPICKVDTYRPQLLTYVDAGSAARELIRWLTSRDPADQVSLSVAEAALSLIGFAAEQGDLRTVVALVRVVEPILTLAGRWQVYSHALHQGMQAAQQLGDQVSQAYFAHQQGTLALCQDQLPAAQQHLQHALELRRRLDDRRGAERTQHNLGVLQPTPPPTPPSPRRRRRVSVGLIMACLVLVVIIGSWTAIGGQSTQSGGGAGGGATDIPPPRPVAQLEVTPSSGPAPLQITASGSTSKAGKGAKITSYDFDFGDGNKTGPQPKATVIHIYESPGTYMVTLTVTNSAGRTAKTSKEVTATDIPPPKPVARLRVGRDGAQFKVYVGADGSASTAGQGAKITSYDFDFGDGHKTGPQSEAKASHTYERPSPGEPAKTYSVKLTVTNSAGQTADVSQGVTVTPSSGPETGGTDPGTGGTDPGGTDPGSCEPGFFWNGNKCVKAPG
jgi:PKD repeat protein